MKKYFEIAIIFTLIIFTTEFCGKQEKFSLKTDKKNYQPGEIIKVEYKAPAEWDSTAWIGIVPSEIKHGKESVNDDNDISYQYLKKSPSGTLEFHAPSAGKYDIRMNNSDNPNIGIEKASTSFEVK